MRCACRRAVAARRRVAAADVPARQAQPQVDPRRPERQALLAALGRPRHDGPDQVLVGADCGCSHGPGDRPRSARPQCGPHTAARGCHRGQGIYLERRCTRSRWPRRTSPAYSAGRRSMTCWRRGRCRRCRSPSTSRSCASASPSRRWCCSSRGYGCAPATRPTATSPAAGRRRWWSCSRSASSPGRSCRSSSGSSGRISWRRSGRCSGSRSRSRASRSSSRRSSSRSTSTAGTACRLACTWRPGCPIVLAGIAGSLLVISVNGWMNHPTGFTSSSGAGVGRSPVGGAVQQPPLPRARPHVPRGLHGRGFIVAAVYARAVLRGRRDRYLPGGAGRPAHGAGAGRAGAARRRRLGGPDGGTGPDR